MTQEDRTKLLCYCIRKPRSTLVFANLPLISPQSDLFGWYIFRFVLLTCQIMELLRCFGDHLHLKLFLKKALLRTVEFVDKLLRMRRSRKQRDRCWPSLGTTITDKHSNESWNRFVRNSIPGAPSPVLENFRIRFSPPNWPPQGLRGWLTANNV